MIFRNLFGSGKNTGATPPSQEERRIHHYVFAYQASRSGFDGIWCRSSRTARRLAGRFVVIEMASTFSAPEPIYIAAASTNPQCIYLLESAGVRPDEAFVARIDPDRTHALFGSTEDLRLQSFLKMIPEPEDCSQGLHQLRSAVLQHLTKYAVVSKRLEKMRVLQSFIE